MNILFFDTETTGFIKKAPITHPSQPHTVQLAAVLADDTGRRFHELNTILKCPVEIPQECADVHGINTETSNAVGLPQVAVLRLFYCMWNMADRIVGHNLAFDKQVLEAALHRFGNGVQLPEKEHFCTMLKSKSAVGAKFKDGRPGKFPTLSEAHQHYFGTEFENAHNAMADVNATIAIYYKLIGEG